ncbi:hypothetical protein N7510_010959 [Penicillium lagena]|uniref:uncharacterized protein n=1 Tax=Penicillium lagena TaxID=94218 RepID=UPI00253F83DD|nr:uncharacterized protein N7510_010959 [Penicillium lagena]KAJ5601425.1 hypothetical protein N7510_010959 [Penicillium lagena]
MDMNSMTMDMASTSTASAAMSTASSGMSGMSGMGGMDMGMGDSSCQISLTTSQMLWNWNTIDACFLSTSWHIRSRGMFAGSCIGVICLVLCLEFLRRVGREYDAFIVQRARLRALYLSGPSADLLIQQSGAAFPERRQKSSSKVNIASCCESHGHTYTDHADPDPSSSSDNIKDDTITSAPSQHCAPPIQTTAPCTHCNTPPGEPISIPFPRATANGLPNPCAVGPFRPSFVEQLVRALLHMLQFAVAYFVMLLAMYFNGYIIICIFIGAFLGSFIFSWEPVSLSKE